MPTTNHFSVWQVLLLPTHNPIFSEKMTRLRVCLSFLKCIQQESWWEIKHKEMSPEQLRGGIRREQTVPTHFLSTPSLTLVCLHQSKIGFLTSLLWGLKQYLSLLFLNSSDYPSLLWWLKCGLQASFALVSYYLCLFHLHSEEKAEKKRNMWNYQ